MGRYGRKKCKFNRAGGCHYLKRRKFKPHVPTARTSSPSPTSVGSPVHYQELSTNVFPITSYRCNILKGPGLKIKLRNSDIPMILDGYRVVSIKQLQTFINTLTLHVANCTKTTSQVLQSPITSFISEKNCGIATILTSKCKNCKTLFRFHSSPKLVNPNMEEKDRFDLNVRAVWGEMVTGGGAAHLNESLATMSSPGLSQVSFSQIEEDICKKWKRILDDKMIEAAKEERRLAIEKGNFHQGVPCISVVCDGGWSKRSHKHSYNAAGGVAIIVGQATKKILHIGVRNKSCYVCTLAESKQQDPPEHTCYKNWTESSQAMEADIILEGFLEAESKHGLRYTKLVADGDSSVYATVQQHVPVWGRDIVKIECANHSCKCLRSSLEKLVDAKPHYKGAHKLSKRARERLVTAVRCAIRMRSQESDKTCAARKLEADIRNSVHHIFGCHSNCSIDFCKVVQTSVSHSQATQLPSQTLFSFSSSKYCADVPFVDPYKLCRNQHDAPIKFGIIIPAFFEEKRGLCVTVRCPSVRPSVRLSVRLSGSSFPASLPTLLMLESPNLYV